MKKHKFKIISASLLLFISQSSFANSSNNGDIKLSAKIDAGCFLTADNINFGVLMMPLTNQTASSQINIQCSKMAPLSVTVQYGNLASSGVYSVAVINGSNTHTVYKDGQNIGSIACNVSAGIQNVYFHTSAVRNLFNPQEIVGNWVFDKYNLCANDTIKADTITALNKKASLTGLVNGDNLFYSLEVPNDASKIWNSTNDYKITGTGNSQIIPVKANILKSDNPTYRMAPDMFQGTLSFNLTY